MVSHGIDQTNIDLGILQETKITDGVYTRSLVGFSMVAKEAPICHHVGIALFYKESRYFLV